MTYTDTNSGITFNNVKFREGAGVGIVPLEIAGVSKPGLDDGVGIINAVDIDWNGAVLPQSNITAGGSLTINTTGDLINLVNEMQKEIYVLSAAVIALSGQV